MLNASIITVRTMRTPVSLRPTVHTAAVTVAMVFGPLGALAAGPSLEAFELAPVLAAILLANTACGLAIAAAGVRDRARIPLPAVDATADEGAQSIPSVDVPAGVAPRRD